MSYQILNFNRMEKLNFVVFSLLLITLQICDAYKPPMNSSNLNKTTGDNSICDSPPTTNIEPEKCCSFPKIFDDSVVQMCERETSTIDKSIAGDLVTDSVRFEIKKFIKV